MNGLTKAPKTQMWYALKLDPNATANDDEEESRGHVWNAHLGFDHTPGDPRGLTISIEFDIDDREGNPESQTAEFLRLIASGIVEIANEMAPAPNGKGKAKAK